MPSRDSCSTHAASDVPAPTSANIVPVAGGGWYAAPCIPRSRKTAISRRETEAPGQYWGGFTEQPPVMPALTSASTQPKNGWVDGTSTNVEGGPVVKSAVHVRSTVIATDVPQPMPRNPPKVEPEAGMAVRPTVVSGAKAATHSPGQLMPSVPLTTVPLPPPVVRIVSVRPG